MPYKKAILWAVTTFTMTLATEAHRGEYGKIGWRDINVATLWAVCVGSIVLASA